MSSRPRPYLTGPEVRRWAPWLIGLALLAIVASGYVVDRDPWIAAFFVLLGLAIAAQAVDGLRTGHLKGRFPIGWDMDASRLDEPFLFWLFATLYLAGGLIFSGTGLLMIVSWLTA